MRTAIVGCGKVAGLHAAALREFSEFVAVCDLDPQRAAAFGVPVYSDTATMVRDARVDAVVICTPHPLHARPAMDACNARAHVLVEKPLASNVADCDAMIEAAERNGVKLGVVSQRRFFEPVLRMKAAINAGKIGKPVLGTVQMFSWRDEAYYRS